MRAYTLLCPFLLGSAHAGTGDYIMQGLGVQKEQEDTTTVSSTITVIVSASTANLVSTANASTILLPPIGASTSHSTALPTTAIVPSDPPTASSTIIPLATSYINHEIVSVSPPPVPIGGGNIEFSGSGSISCANCTSFGFIEYSTSGFTPVSTNNGTDQTMLDELGTAVDDTPTSGSFHATFHAVSGYMEFSATPTGTLSHDFALLTLPILGFALPGVGNAGLKVEIKVPISLTLSSFAEIFWGFEWSVPSGAQINLPLDELSNTSLRGFKPEEGFSISALPVHINASDLDVQIHTSLQWQLGFGIEASGAPTFTNAAVFLDLPSFNVSVVGVEGVDAACNPGGKREAFQISPVVGMDVGVSAEALDLWTESAELWNTSFPLSTMCETGKAAVATTTGTSTSLSIVPSTAVAAAAITGTAVSTGMGTVVAAGTGTGRLAGISSGSLPTTTNGTSPSSAMISSRPSYYTGGTAAKQKSPAALMWLPFVYWAFSRRLD